MMRESQGSRHTHPNYELISPQTIRESFPKEFSSLNLTLLSVFRVKKKTTARLREKFLILWPDSDQWRNKITMPGE